MELPELPGGELARQDLNLECLDQNQVCYRLHHGPIVTREVYRHHVPEAPNRQNHKSRFGRRVAMTSSAACTPGRERPSAATERPMWRLSSDQSVDHHHRPHSGASADCRGSVVGVKNPAYEHLRSLKSTHADLRSLKPVYAGPEESSTKVRVLLCNRKHNNPDLRRLRSGVVPLRSGFFSAIEGTATRTFADSGPAWFHSDPGFSLQSIAQQPRPSQTQVRRCLAAITQQRRT